MTYAFDTLGYAKRLRAAGISPEQAEAHAEAAREFVMGELVTRYDLDVTRRELEAKIDRVNLGLDSKIDRVNQGLEARISGVKQELEAKIDGVKQGLEGKIDGVRQELDARIDRVLLQMTVRLGGMIAIAVAILATIIKL